MTAYAAMESLEALCAYCDARATDAESVTARAILSSVGCPVDDAMVDLGFWLGEGIDAILRTAPADAALTSIVDAITVRA